MIWILMIILFVIGFVLFHKGGGGGGAAKDENEKTMRFYGQLLMAIAIGIIIAVNLWFKELLL